MRTLLFVLLLLFFACEESEKQAEKALPITEYTAGDGLLIDVRTPMEYELGHLEGAINIDWKNPGFEKAFDTIPKERKLYVYCHMGGRSAKAAAILRSLGYSVTDLTGGYSEFQP